MCIKSVAHSGPGVMLISNARSDAHYVVMLIRIVMLIRMSITNDHHSRVGVMLISDAHSNGDAHSNSDAHSNEQH